MRRRLPDMPPTGARDQSPEDSPPLDSGRTKQNAKNFWITLAIGSGAFAAFNGVFAKLTTGTSTGIIVAKASRMFGVTEGKSTFVEIVIRALFFGLNILSNAVMWILFTKALTAGNSTTRVSVINTSANFFVTAVLGMLIFSEGLPPSWWAGASLLVAGSVIIGARDEGSSESGGMTGRFSDGDVALDTSNVLEGETPTTQDAFSDDLDGDEHHAAYTDNEA